MNQTAKQQLSRNPSNAGYSTPLKTYSIPASTNEDGTINVPAQPVYGIDPNHEPIDLYMATRQIPGGQQFVMQANATAIGNLWTIPAGRGVILDSLCCDITATATVGNRTYLAQVVDGLGSNAWRGALSTAVTAAQICGYDVGFGSVGAPSTVVRTRLGGLTAVNVMVREQCPIKALQNQVQTVIGGVNAIGPITVGVIDAAAIDAADAVLWRLTGRVYDP